MIIYSYLHLICKINILRMMNNERKNVSYIYPHAITHLDLIRNSDKFSTFINLIRE